MQQERPISRETFQKPSNHRDLNNQIFMQSIILLYAIWTTRTDV
jgi:hypothetical protein